LNLATAGGLDLAEASEIMSTALNSFKKDAMTAADASNILAGTANASATDVHDLKYSLSMVSAVASGIGLNFKDVNSALGVFANNGLKGSDAGTSLKTLLLNLSPITKNQTKEFAALGITTKKGGNQFFDAAGNIKSMAEIAGVLQKQLKGLTNEQRQATLKMMFGTDAIRAANILYEEGADGIKKFQAEMDKVTAFQVATEKMNNSKGAIEQFKGALETLQISVLLPLLPTIKKAANNMATFVQNLKPAQIQAWGDHIKNAGEDVLKFAKFVYDNWKPIKEVLIAITAGIVAARIAMIGLNIAMMANPVGLIIEGIGLLVAVAVLLYRNFDIVKAKVIQLWPTLRMLLGPIGALIQAGINLASHWDDTWTSIKQGAATAVNYVIGKINGLIKAINLIPGVKIPLIPKVDWGATNPNTRGYSQAGATYGYSMGPKGHSHHGGISNIPYDGYAIRAHKNERLLTAVENDEYKKNGGKGGTNVSFAGAIFNVRQESDIKNIAYELARMIEREGAMM